MDYLCAKFGDFSFQPFRFYRLDTQNHRITEADDRYTQATTVGVCNKRRQRAQYPRFIMTITAQLGKM